MEIHFLKNVELNKEYTLLPEHHSMNPHPKLPDSDFWVWEGLCLSVLLKVPCDLEIGNVSEKGFHSNALNVYRKH